MNEDNSDKKREGEAGEMEPDKENTSPIQLD